MVNAICFWDEMPKEKWKRPFVLVVCSLMEIGVFYWMFLSADPAADVWAAKILSLVIASFCGLGLVVSFKGCDQCVAQVCGKAQT